MVWFSPANRTTGPVVDPSPLVPLRWPYLAVVDIAGMGRGVITTRDLPKGALIERAPVFVIPTHQRVLTDKTTVANYALLWEDEPLHRSSDDGGRIAIALGITSLVNHSQRPNARLRCFIEAEGIELRAIRDIPAGEEILIDYATTLSFTPASCASDRAA